MSRKSCLIRLFKTTVSCKLFTAIILSVFLGQPALTYAGVVIGGTRVVYLSNNADKSISVFSKEEKIPYLIQAWVDPFNKEDKIYVHCQSGVRSSIAVGILENKGFENVVNIREGYQDFPESLK